MQGAFLKGKIIDVRVLDLEGLPLKRRNLNSKPCFAWRTGYPSRGCAVAGGVFEGKMNDFRVLELEGLPHETSKIAF